MFPKLLDDFTLIGLFKTFYSEVIIASWEVAEYLCIQKDPCVHFAQFPPLVTFYITIIQYQNQEVDTGINICIVLYHFITCV